MQPYQNRVRRMRPPRKSARRLGRSTDGTRRNYYKPSPLATGLWDQTPDSFRSTGTSPNPR